MAAEAIKAFESRLFEKILTTKVKNANFRRKIFRNLLTELIQNERVETTLPRAKNVAMVANRMIDLAKKKEEPIIYTWLTKKALVPKVFDVLLPRYADTTEFYTRVYRIPPRKKEKAPMGIVEFIGNNLPPLELPEDELLEKKRDFLIEKLQQKYPDEGVLV